MFVLLIILLSTNPGISSELSDTLEVQQKSFWEDIQQVYKMNLKERSCNQCSYRNLLCLIREETYGDFEGNEHIEKEIENRNKESKRLGFGISGSFFRTTRQYENALESWNPIVSGKISLRDQNLHLCCIFSYYFPMYTDYIRIIDNGVPISVTYHLEVWECNLLPASFLYDFKNITFSFGNGIIIGYGALNSSMSGHSMNRSFFYPLSFGVSLNSSFTFSFRKNISITLDIDAKHYVFMKRNEPSFKVEGITGGVGLEYYFPIPKRR